MCHILMDICGSKGLLETDPQKIASKIDNNLHDFVSS